MARASRDRKGSAESRTQPKAPLVHLEDCWDEPDQPRTQAYKDVEDLQGAWAVIVGRRRAQFLVSGNHLTVHFADGDIYMGSFILDPFSSPKGMTVQIDEGPSQHKGQTAKCIYELEGAILYWCTAGPGQAEAPEAFSVENDSRYLSLVLQREHLNGRA
jgi:uncharacterized protein (TIGR03067 family)